MVILQIFARILVLVCKTSTNQQHCSKQGVRDREPRNYIYPKESNFLRRANNSYFVMLSGFLHIKTRILFCCRTTRKTSQTTTHPALKKFSLNKTGAHTNTTIPSKTKPPCLSAASSSWMATFPLYRQSCRPKNFWCNCYFSLLLFWMKQRRRLRLRRRQCRQMFCYCVLNFSA